MEPGQRMAMNGHAVPFVVLGDEVVSGVTGDGSSNEAPIRVTADGHVELDLPRQAIPLQAGETVVSGSGVPE
jgi:hypothetical protein